MLILSNGYQLPETGDLGSVWFPSLESNIQRLNDHSHDGNDSNQLESVNLIQTVQTVLAAEFSASGNGYEAQVTLTSPAQTDTTNIVVRDPTTKDRIYIEVTRVSSVEVRLYTNFVQDFEVLLG